MTEVDASPGFVSAFSDLNIQVSKPEQWYWIEYCFTLRSWRIVEFLEYPTVDHVSVNLSRLSRPERTLSPSVRGNWGLINIQNAQRHASHAAAARKSHFRNNPA